MPKEKSINPAQAERKKEKAKAVKKGKAEAQTRRTEKLARRNPERLQRQLDELKALESSGSKLTTHQTRVLEELERELKAVRKARDTLGDKAPSFRRDGGRGGGGAGGVLGKRRRDGNDGSDSNSESDTPDDVRCIPMPRDTPPPIPREVLDKWHTKRRERWARHHDGGDQRLANAGTSANSMPLGANLRFGSRGGEEGGEESVTKEVRQEVHVPAQMVYEAKAVIRDLRKEAVSAFVPAAVRVKLEKAKGKGGLVEPEEADRLEREGYMGGGEGEGESSGVVVGPRGVEMEEVEDEND